MSRLPQLRFDKRMQLIRLNTGPSGRRGNGLFVVLVEEVAERAETRPASSDHDRILPETAQLQPAN